MEALRTWTISGDVPLTITIHQPAVTIRQGDGPETQLSPQQARALSERMVEAEDYFDTQNPEVLD